MAEIRRMEEADLDQVVEIERLVFPNPWSRWAFESELQVAISNCFVLEEEGLVAGYIIYRLLGEQAHILNIALRPEWQGRGWGRRLMEWALDRMKREGVRFVWLEVRASNKRAIKLYQKLGFKVLKVIKNYYYNPVEDALLMVKKLD